LDGNVRAAVAAFLRAFGDGIEGSRRTEFIKSAPQMIARLHGKNFEIQGVGGEERTVVRGLPTEWTWYVKPTELGENSLRLEFFAIIPRGKEFAREQVRTFDTWIDVNVEPPNWLTYQWQLVTGSAVGIAAIFGVFSAVWNLKKVLAAWRARRRRWAETPISKTTAS
jgi:hypothetical protein